MSQAPHPIAVLSDLESEDPASPTSYFAPAVMPMLPATSRYMQSQQWLPASDSENSPPASPAPLPSPPGPIICRRRVRRLRPYEPEPFGRLFHRYEGGHVRQNTSQKRVCALAAPAIPPPAFERTKTPSPAPPSSVPSPTIFYRQTTTVPLPSSTPPTSPATHSDPLPSHDKACHLILSS
jgi:hypothetical protein